MRTIHARAKGLLDIFGGSSGTSRRRAMQQAASRAIAESDDRPEQPALDYREWRPDWDWSMPLMIGSGRRADWCHQSYRYYASLCESLHRDLGWSGDRVRAPARQLAKLGNLSAHDDGWLPDESVPTASLLRIGREPERRSDAVALADEAATGDTRRAQWRLWLAHVGRPAWGRQELARTAYRLDHDPSYRTPAMAVGLIRQLRGEGGQDYRGCSGCEWLDALAERPDLWDEMLARAPSFVRGRYGELDAVYTPLGLEAPQEYDYAIAIGLNYEICVRGAEYEAAVRGGEPLSRWTFQTT